MTDTQAVRMVPEDLDDEMIRVSLAVEWPATYRTHLRHPDDGKSQAAKTEALIARERKRWSAMLAAAPSIQPDREVNRFVVVNIGCIECGVSSDIVGTYATREEADEVAQVCDGGLSWRQGGQNSFEVFDLQARQAEEYATALALPVQKEEG